MYKRQLLRDALGSLLEQAGHRVTMAPDGESALARFAEAAFDGVVLDLGLPGIDGLAVLRRLRAQQPALPVLILTARDGVDDRVAGLNAGADDYLTKPFSGDELKARLQAMLRRAKLPAFGPSGTASTGSTSSGARLAPAAVSARPNAGSLDRRNMDCSRALSSSPLNGLVR